MNTTTPLQCHKRRFLLSRQVRGLRDYRAGKNELTKGLDGGLSRTLRCLPATASSSPASRTAAPMRCCCCEEVGIWDRDGRMEDEEMTSRCPSCGEYLAQAAEFFPLLGLRQIIMTIQSSTLLL